MQYLRMLERERAARNASGCTCLCCAVDELSLRVASYPDSDLGAPESISRKVKIGSRCL